MPSSDQAGFPIIRALVNLVRAAVKRQEWWRGVRGGHRVKPTHQARGREPKTSNKRDENAAASKTVSGACCKKKLEKRSELIHK